MRNIYYNYSYSALVNQREPNLIIVFGDNPEFSVPIYESKTKIKRIKWWIFSKIFPVSHEWVEQ
jgi:hypothetical protein